MGGTANWQSGIVSQEAQKQAQEPDWKAGIVTAPQPASTPSIASGEPPQVQPESLEAQIERLAPLASYYDYLKNNYPTAYKHFSSPDEPPFLVPTMFGTFYIPAWGQVLKSVLSPGTVFGPPSLNEWRQNELLKTDEGRTLAFNEILKYVGKHPVQVASGMGTLSPAEGVLPNKPPADISTLMQPSSPLGKGIATGIGGVLSPANIGLMLTMPESRLMGAYYTGAMSKNTLDALLSARKEYKAGNKDRATELIGQALVTGGMAGVGTYFTAKGETPLNLNKGEQAYLLSMLQNHYEQSAKNLDYEGMDQAVDSLKGIAPSLDRGEEVEGERPTVEQAQANLPQAEGELAPGQVYPAVAEALNAPSPQVSGEEDIRNVSGGAGGEGAASATPIPSPIEGGNGGEASQGELALTQSVGELQSIIPEFQKAVGGDEGVPPGATSPIPPLEPLRPEDALPEEPAISEAVDRDLANNNINVIREGRDMWRTGRWLGSLSESARLLNQQGHPLGPVLTSMAGMMSDVTKAIARNTIDTMSQWKNGAKRIVSKEEWSGPVVSLLDNPDITPDNRPANTPDHIWQAYLITRAILEDHRIRIIDAQRQALKLMYPNIKDEAVVEIIPDDWGIGQGYYPHIFPGDWTITKLSGVDERGNPIYEPIETGWRARSRNEANAKAAEYVASNPGSQMDVRQDTYSLPGKNLSDRRSLIDLANQLKDATTREAAGQDMNELLEQLYADTAKAAYGPLRIARRQYGRTLEREANLAGWATDRDTFERYLAATERYIQLAPARIALMKARNAIASLAGMPEVQRPTEFPTLKYGSARQYPNILARVDGAMEGLEGHPSETTVAFRSMLNKMGLDPNLANNWMRPIQSIAALTKLGFRPVRVLSHGLQSLWGVLPTIGGRYTLEGLAHSYNPAYDFLIKDLAISHATSATDLESMRTYMADYFGRGSNPVDWTKGVGSILYDVGMFPFTFGIDTTRRIAAIGAFRKAIDSGMDVVGARNAARDAMDRSTGIYNSADNSIFLRQLPGPVSQFKNFMLKTFQFMYGLRTPQEIGYFLLAAGALGYGGFPLIRSFGNAIYNSTGFDPENYLKRLFPHASRGVFGALGVETPPGVGLGDLGIARTDVPAWGLLGPAASDTIAVSSAIVDKAIRPNSRETQQKLDNALRNISPAARSLYDEGVRQAEGDSSLIDPRTGSVIIRNLTPRERAELALGLTPLRVAEERDTHEYIRNLLAQHKDVRGFFVDRMAELEISLSSPQLSDAQKADAMRQIVSLSKEAQDNNVGAGLAKAVRDRAKEMQLERLRRDIRLAPRPLRPQIGQAIQSAPTPTSGDWKSGIVNQGQ